MRNKLSLHSLQALNAFDGMAPVQRHDSLAAFVQNELLAVIPEMYDRLYSELDALRHVPMRSGIHPAAMAWGYDSISRAGKANWLGANGNDIPRVDVAKERLTFPVRTMALSYGWTVEEIEAARMIGMPLDREKADSCRRGIAEFEHQVVLFGDSSLGIPGFLSNPKTPLVIVPNGDWLGSATPDQIIQDFNYVIDAMFVGTDKVHNPNTVLMDVGRYRKLQTTRLTDTGESLMSYLSKTNPAVQEILPLSELATVRNGAPALLAYEKRPDRVGAVIPLPFEQMEPQVQGMEVIVPCRERIGGTVWIYPQAGVFGVGI